MDKNIMEKAREYATAAHEGQTEDSGLPYIVHPLQVCNILIQITEDVNILAAALLHDTIEDTETTYEDLVREFGTDIADLVNEVTHEGDSKSGYYFPRLKTQRGIMIKLADRLSNISRMEPWSEERRQHYYKSTKFWKSEPNEVNALVANSRKAGKAGKGDVKRRGDSSYYSNLAKMRKKKVLDTA